MTTLYTAPRGVRRFGTGAALAVIGAAMLTGCAGGSSAPVSSSVAADMAQAVTVTDAWAKAADSGMSAAFGVLENTSSSEVQLVAVTSPVSSEVQLHETITDADGNSVMQEKDGGFTLGAGSTLTLEPGGNHIMFMSLDEPLLAGDTVDLTLEFSDGSELEVSAPIREYSGANESYMGDEDDAMDGMDMSESSSASATAMSSDMTSSEGQ